MDNVSESSTTVKNSHDATVAPATSITLIDDAIRAISGRDLVSTSEMTDLLLDIRLYLLTESSRESSELA